MVELKKLKVRRESLVNLPLFYQFIQYNKLINVDVYSEPVYSEKYTSYIPFGQPAKLISKIIDFSHLNFDDDAE